MRRGRGKWRVSCIKEITWKAKNSGGRERERERERERVVGVMKAEVEIVKLLKYLQKRNENKISFFVNENNDVS